MVLARKKDGYIRLCIDSGHLNKASSVQTRERYIYIYIAVTLSRAYQQVDESDYNEYHDMNIEVLSNTRLDEQQTETKEDHTSSMLATLINKGWPDKYYVILKEAQPYYSFRDELSMSNDINMRGHRCMIPKSLQTYYVEQLHKGHPGIKATKQRASEHVYLNNMYEHLDIAVKKCAPYNALIETTPTKRNQCKYMKHLNSHGLMYPVIYLNLKITSSNNC